MPSLSALDKWFFQVETTETPSTVGLLVTLELPEDAPSDYVLRLAEDMRASTSFAPPFTYQLTRPALRRINPTIREVDPREIDLSYHFRHSALPQPGAERQLGELVSRLFSRPLDPHKPMWECHIIEGLENRRFAWFFKIHHAFMDGQGAMRRVQQMLDPDPHGTRLTPVWTLGPPARPPRDAADGRSGASPIAQAQRVLGGVLGGARGALGSARDLAGVTLGSVSQAVRPTGEAIAAPYTAPSSILNRRITQNRRFATQRYELDRVKAVAKGSGVTVNEVFLAICAGGLRRYLRELGELPDKSLVALLPVSIRPAGDVSAGNAISSMFVKLRTDVADPAGRIAAIAESSRTAKENLQSMSKVAIEAYPMLFALPQTLQQLTGLAGRSPCPYNVLLTNVAGPGEQLYMCGAKLESANAITVITHGMGLCIAAGSISGWLNLGFTACRDTVPHLQRLAVYTGEALEELEAALAAPKKPATRRRAGQARAST